MGRLELALVNIDCQWHHRTVNVEIVGEGEDCHENLPDLQERIRCKATNSVDLCDNMETHCPSLSALVYLEGHVVEEFHGFLRQIARTALRVENLTNILELSCHIRVNEGDLQRRIHRYVFHEFSVGEIVRQL